MNGEIWPSSAKRKVSTKGSIPWTCDGLKMLHILSSSLRSPANQTQRSAQIKNFPMVFVQRERETFTDSLSVPLRGLRRPVSNLLPTSCVMKCWAQLSLSWLACTVLEPRAGQKPQRTLPSFVGLGFYGFSTVCAGRGGGGGRESLREPRLVFPSRCFLCVTTRSQQRGTFLF